MLATDPLPGTGRRQRGLAADTTVTGLVFETRGMVALLPFVAMTTPAALGYAVGRAPLWRSQPVTDHMLSEQRHLSSAEDRLGG